jgi:hypothetical protein
MINGNMEIVQADPLNANMFTKKRISEKVNGKNCVTFSFCNRDGEITNNKGIPYNHSSKYTRCLEFDGVRTCNCQWVHKSSVAEHCCTNSLEIIKQKTINNYNKKANNILETEEEKHDKKKPLFYSKH